MNIITGGRTTPQFSVFIVLSLILTVAPHYTVLNCPCIYYPHFFSAALNDFAKTKFNYSACWSAQKFLYHMQEVYMCVRRPFVMHTMTKLASIAMVFETILQFWQPVNMLI